MNRSALCIKMLHILYGRNKPISREELATLLETNVRNVIEFKKELETAGYVIDSITGKYGGYLLNEDSVFPSLSLNSDEKKAINEALKYLATQKNFIYYPTFETAMDKLKAKLNHATMSRQTIYLSDARNTLSEKESEMVDLVSLAKENSVALQFLYRSFYHNETSLRTVLPYELVISDEGFYLLGEDKTKDKTNGFKYFKIIEERMSNLCMSKQKFQRDHDFKISDHIGSSTLMKELHEVELEIYGINARLVNEREIENLIYKEFKDDVLHIRFMMAGDLRLKSFILSLGSECKVIAPQSIKQEIQEELNKALANYKKNS